jgi:hypothetical protein
MDFERVLHIMLADVQTTIGGAWWGKHYLSQCMVPKPAYLKSVGWRTGKGSGDGWKASVAANSKAVQQLGCAAFRRQSSPTSLHAEGRRAE